MMRSMFSGVSGLRIHQTKMDVIANNISNVNTVGYKAARATFNEVFSQTIAGASGANANSGRGGVNAMQIGLGANVSSIDKLMTSGAAQRTDNPFDVMIQGDGFLIVGDESGNYFTRAGAMNIDESGSLVNSSGLKVMGWDTKSEGGTFVVEKGNVKPIMIMGDKNYITPTPTTTVNFEGNLNGDTQPIRTTTLDFYDTVGNRYVLDTQFAYDSATGAWSYNAGDIAYPNGDRTKGVKIDNSVPGAISFSPDPVPDITTFAPMYNLKFDTNGVLLGSDISPTVPVDGVAGVTSLSLNVPDPPANLLQPGSTFGNSTKQITLNFGAMTGFANESPNAKAVKADGNEPGSLTGLNIGSDGIITGRYSNGETRILAQIPVATFANAAGLEKVGDNLFITTPNSGDFDGIGEEVQSGGGKMMGGVLEMSNVDLASEFTEMITTQRGFQANSRVITTSDDMLQELVNLKR